MAAGEMAMATGRQARQRQLSQTATFVAVALAFVAVYVAAERERQARGSCATNRWRLDGVSMASLRHSVSVRRSPPSSARCSLGSRHRLREAKEPAMFSVLFEVHPAADQW